MTSSEKSDRGYSVRQCRTHFHIMICGHDLIGGECSTREEADEKCARLNAGEGTENVLGSLVDYFHNIMTRGIHGGTEQDRNKE